MSSRMKFCFNKKPKNNALLPYSKKQTGLECSRILSYRLDFGVFQTQNEIYSDIPNVDHASIWKTSGPKHFRGVVLLHCCVMDPAGMEGREP